ncbi:hypothetical protein [Natronomonas marina]|uniref:hypothetical protein n=1 Tax=Natronomonas marina TaxID=2961939 RepID=UPI0020CA11D8|nr:hypothetical protein [Natronomonas marina]
MTRGLEPTESYDGSITVHVLNDKRDDVKIQCASYQEAIRTVKQHRDGATATKIADRDGRIVFTSAEMKLEEWVAEWERAKRSLSVDVEAHECPYDNVACVADDLCVKCQMDVVRDQ